MPILLLASLLLLANLLLRVSLLLFTSVMFIYCPAAVDIHEVPIFPVTATAVISVNGVPAVVDLPACSCWLHYFTSVLAFAGVPTVLTVLLFLSFLLFMLN
jgi:hypothetical protein